jgi:hypothetical protein
MIIIACGSFFKFCPISNIGRSCSIYSLKTQKLVLFAFKLPSNQTGMEYIYLGSRDRIFQAVTSWLCQPCFHFFKPRLNGFASRDSVSLIREFHILGVKSHL